MDKLEKDEARRIYEEAAAAMDNLASIVTECTTGEYISKRYIREKIRRAAYAVRDIFDMVVETEGENE